MRVIVMEVDATNVFRYCRDTALYYAGLYCADADCSCEFPSEK